MGTRSTYRVIEQWKDKGKVINTELCLVYVQYDGYPTGHPLAVAEWLSKGKVVNGLKMNETKLVFNGAGCLAAQLVSKLKGDGAGGTYIHPLKHRGNCGEDYLYDVIVKEDFSIEYVCHNNYEEKELFRGTPEEFVNKYSVKAETI